MRRNVRPKTAIPVHGQYSRKSAKEGSRSAVVIVAFDSRREQLFLVARWAGRNARVGQKKTHERARRTFPLMLRATFPPSHASYSVSRVFVASCSRTKEVLCGS